MLKPHFRHYLAVFLLDAAMMISLTPLPFFIFDHLDGGARMSGVIFAAQSLCYTVVCLVSTQFVARVRNGLTWAIAGGIGYTVLFPLSAVFHEPYLFGVVSVAGIGSLALFWPAMQSWLGGEPDPKRRARHLALYNVAWSAGLAVGPLIGGPLYNIHHLLPFLVTFLVSAVATVLVCSLPHEKALFVGSDDEVAEGRAVEDPAGKSYLYPAWVANMTAYALVGVTRSVFPKRVEELVGSGQLVFFSQNRPGAGFLSSATTTYTWLAFVILAASSVVFFLMGKTRRWRYVLWPTIISQIAAAAALWGLGSTRSFVVMVLCFTILGVNAGVCYFGSLYYSLSNAACKHRRATINEVMIGVGNTLGCLGFGHLAAQLGTPWPFLHMPLAVVAAILFQLVLHRAILWRQERAG
jgi:MFS family permease